MRDHSEIWAEIYPPYRLRLCRGNALRERQFQSVDELLGEIRRWYVSGVEWEPDQSTRRVRVVKCSNPTYWWNNRIGEVFTVDEEFDGDTSGDIWVIEKDGKSYLMSIEDTEPCVPVPAAPPA